MSNSSAPPASAPPDARRCGTSASFLFGGPFNGSTQSFTVEAIDVLGGRHAIMELQSRLTGCVALPPGLTAHEPGLLRARTFLVLERRNGAWQIIRQQLTSVAPDVP
jgi:hypothetical protein